MKREEVQHALELIRIPQFARKADAAVMAEFDRRFALEAQLLEACKTVIEYGFVDKDDAYFSELYAAIRAAEEQNDNSN